MRVDDGLEVHARELSAQARRLDPVEQPFEALPLLGQEVPVDEDPDEVGAGDHVVEDLVEAPAAVPVDAHLVVRLAIAVERHHEQAVAEAAHLEGEVGGEPDPIGGARPAEPAAARLHRGAQHLRGAKHEVLAGERLASEVVYVQDAQRALVQRAQDPLERGVLRALVHLGEGRMVLLEAVAASEVAGERGHQGDLHGLRLALGGPVEERAQIRVILRARAHQEAFLEQHLVRLALGGVRRAAPARPALQRVGRGVVDADVMIGEDAVEHVLAGSDVAVRDDEP